MVVTKRQKQVLDFVSRFIEDNGYSPSYEEIARGLDLASLATVHKHISTLETKQYLKRGFNQSRSLDQTAKVLLVQVSPGNRFDSMLQLGKGKFARHQFKNHRAIFELRPQPRNGGGKNAPMVETHCFAQNGQ